jgi:hypothetical protein
VPLPSRPSAVWEADTRLLKTLNLSPHKVAKINYLQYLCLKEAKRIDILTGLQNAYT